ncbi:MAG: hypothetical protein RR246_00795 [Clostridia bacterium]
MAEKSSGKNLQKQQQNKSAQPTKQKPDQKPQQRKPQVTARSLTPEKRAKLARIRKIKVHKRRQILAVLLLLLTFYLLISLVIVGFLVFNFSHVSTDNALYSLRLSNGKKNIVVIDAETANNSDDMYVSFTNLNKIFDMGMIGDKENATIVFRKSHEYFSCTANSRTVYINGMPAGLISPVILLDDDYYFPFEFIKDYFEGLSIVYDKEKLTCTLKLENPDTIVALKLKPIEECPSIKETSETSNTSKTSG